VHRKKASERKIKKDVLVTGINVISAGNGAYYGFQLDGDGLFLLGNFTVSHNSDIIAGIADELNMELLVSHPVVSDPTDYKGLPGIVDGEADFLPFGDLKALITAKKPTIAFLDDLGQAPAVVQAAAMQLILARQVNGKAISDKVIFVAATNRREDRAGVTGILEPVKSRFATIIELTVDSDQWIEWAFENDMPAELIGFVHFRPSLLHSPSPTADIVNHPCPRTIAYAGKLMQAGLDDVETLAGAIGEGCASELVGFIKVFRSLPNIAAILADPDNAAVPDEPAALYAVVSALVDRVTEDNAQRILRYGERLPADFSVLMVRDMIRKKPAIQNTTAFIQWATTHKEVLM
ncbi:hypothetical protein LCGC14_1555330, partial [marine sediment metagenome]